MEPYKPQHDNAPFTAPPLLNPPPQIFGGSDESPTDPNFSAGPFFAEDLGGAMDESNEAKRRRIARVRASLP